MVTITLRLEDKGLNQRLRELARKDGTSLNKAVQKVLREATGLADQPVNHRADFVDMLGAWSKRDLMEFERSTADLSRVDAGDWT